MAMFLARIKKILNLGTKSISANGTYNASTDGYDGFSSVTVNVPTVTPTSITPSNTSPVALTANTAVTPTTAGYAIASYSSLNPAPAGSSPEGFAAGMIKMSNNGFAVRTYNSVTPSDSNPPQLNESYLYFMNHSGYLYETQQTTPTPTITRIAKADYATSSSSSQPGTVYTKTGLDPNKQYIVVATGTTNCGNADGYIAIGSSSNRIYIPTHSNSQSATNATISSVITGASSTSVLLGWVNSHSSVWFKYSVTIYEVA